MGKDLVCKKEETKRIKKMEEYEKENISYVDLTNENTKKHNPRRSQNLHNPYRI